MNDQDAAKRAEAAAERAEEAAEKAANFDAIVAPGGAAPNAASGGPGRSEGKYNDEE